MDKKYNNMSEVLYDDDSKYNWNDAIRKIVRF